MNPIGHGELVYFKFRSIVGVTLPTRTEPGRVAVVIVSNPPNAPYRKGEVIHELVDNLEPFNIELGGHLLR